MLRYRGYRTDPKKNQQIRRRYTKDLARFGKDLAIFDEDSAKIWRLKLTPTSTDPTVVHRSPIQLDPRFPVVGSGSFNFSPDVSGSVPGWAQTRPGPTRGHPYSLCNSPSQKQISLSRLSLYHALDSISCF